MRKHLVVIGTNSIDKYYQMDAVPVMGDKVICTRMGDEIGGMLANAAAVYAGYGGKTYMIDYVNNGSGAEAIMRRMEADRVDTSYFTRDDAIEDSVCLIMLKDGERVIFVIPNTKVDLVLSEAQAQLVRTAGCVYTTLQELDTFADPLALVADIAQSDAMLALDIEGSTLRFKKRDWQILQQCGVIFVNDGGNKRLCELYGEGYLAALNAAGCMVVRTYGAEGCGVYQNGEEAVRVPGHRVKVVDTTGAGDTFNASFLHGLACGWPPECCAQFSNAAAARAVGLFGPRAGVATEEEINAFMHSTQT